MYSKRWRNSVVTGESAEEVERVIAQLEASADQAAQRNALWGRDERTRMTRLCWSFPTLVHADGVLPWNPERFLRWLLTSGAPGSGARHAAKFVLQVWNSSTDWAAWARESPEKDGLGIADAELAPFNVVDALAVWDDEHASAFRTWAELPFWP
jgi:hypothetical protein